MKQKVKSKTELPSGYISWSQIVTVEKSPEQYIQTYLYGKKTAFKSMEYGKTIHKKLAKGIRPKGMQVPLYTETDVKMECILKRGKDTVRVIGEFDGFSKIRNVIGEYKTDTSLWSYHKAKGHDQQKLYALMKYRETGTIPSAELTCLETENVLGKMKLTGRFVTHSIPYTMQDMLEVEVRVWRAYDKIIKLVETELNKLF